MYYNTNTQLKGKFGHKINEFLHNVTFNFSIKETIMKETINLNISFRKMVKVISKHDHIYLNLKI